MIRRRTIDYVLGRHYCPACGKALGFRQGESRKSGDVRWYQLAPQNRALCNACGAEVQVHVANGVWIALAIWAAVAVGATFTFETLKDHGVISGGSFLTLAFVLVVCFSGACLFQVFISYRLVQSPS